MIIIIIIIIIIFILITIIIPANALQLCHRHSTTGQAYQQYMVANSNLHQEQRKKDRLINRNDE
jgi:hypothetical protein